MRCTRPLAAVLVAAALTLTACGGGSGSDSSGSEPATPTTEASTNGDGGGGGGAGEVKIADFAFDPSDTEVKVGDSVTFTNDDDATHTATSGDDAPKSFDTGDIEGGKSAEVTFDEAGDYPYVCSIHEYMKGTIRVLE